MVAVSAASTHRASSQARTHSHALDGVASGREALREGSNGPAVREVQKLLNRNGANLEVDGDFGPRTAAAVRGFQRSHGLDPDGVVGPRTLGKLTAGRTTQAAHERQDALRMGDRGAKILGMERRLSRLGYDVGAVDGKFDAATRSGVAAFKADQADIKDKRGGVMGDTAQRVLNQETRALNHDPYRARIKDSAQHRRLDALTAQQAARTDATTGNVGIGPESSGRAVKNVQAHLRSAGFDPKHVNGVFDERTQGALKAFQNRSNLPATGRVDTATWNALRKARMEARNGTSPAQSLGERSAAVLHSERLLQRLGYKPGKVDGVFDRDTLRASRRFETRHRGTGTTGDIGAGQLRAMEREARNSAGGITRPLAARLTSTSEFRLSDAEGAPSVNGGRFHAGKDWFAPGGTAVKSPISGRIVEVRASSGNSGQVFGGTVKVQGSDGKVWVFRHVDPRGVRVGQRVDAGDHIANVTRWRDGPSHTHIELWKTLSGGYRFENMLDPMSVLKRFL